MKIKLGKAKRFSYNGTVYSGDSVIDVDGSLMAIQTLIKTGDLIVVEPETETKPLTETTVTSRPVETIEDKVSRFDELKALNRSEQIELIESFGYEGKIPLREAGRIELILELESKE